MSNYKSKIEKITYRNWQDEQDFLEIEKIGNQYNQAYHIDQVYNAKDDSKWLLAQIGFDPKQHYFIAEYENNPVGIMTFYINKEIDGPYIFRKWMIIHPEWINTELPSEMFDLTEQIIKEAAKQLPAGEKAIYRNGYQDREEWRKELLESKGYTTIRYFMKWVVPQTLPFLKNPFQMGLK